MLYVDIPHRSEIDRLFAHRATACMSLYLGPAFTSGARVLGVCRADIPGGASLAAILRYPF